MSPSERRIDVAIEFSDEPYGRISDDGDWNGTRFREEFLVPALNDFDRVIVDFSGVLGVGSSFLEESFGGLVRKGLFSKAELEEKLTIKHPLESYLIEVWEYIDRAHRK